jgi:hypothetical protein
MQELRKTGTAPPAIYTEMKQVKPLLDAGKVDEAEAVVDRSLATLEGVDPGPSAPAQPQRAPLGPRDHAMLAIIPGSPDGDATLVPSAFHASRALGAELLYWYMSYADLAKNEGSSFVTQALAKGGPIAINFGIIRTTVQGRYPKPWTSFDEPGFAAAFAEAAGRFASRHRPDYIFIGNEANP